MVRSSETSGNEDFIKLAADRGHPLFMGSGIPRVLRTGSGKQNRIHRQRGAFQPDAAEGHPGSDIAYSVYGNRDLNVQEPGTPVEPFCSVFLPDSGCFLRFSEII